MPAFKNIGPAMVGLTLLAGLLFSSCKIANASERIRQPDEYQIAAAAHLAAAYLVHSVQPNGRFVYRRHLNPEVVPKDRYNMLRHAGTIYAMAMHYERMPSDALRTAILRSGSYLVDASIRTVSGQKAMAAIWSDPEINHSSKPVQAKLGGTGLGLVALAGIDRIEPGFLSIGTLQDLGRFILHMQKADGSFYSKYIPSQGGRQDQWVSLYYPGEAALGLLFLYEMDPDPQWFQASARALRHLADQRKNQANVPADHWALIATAKLLSIADERDIQIHRKQLSEHAMQICRQMLRDLEKKDGRVTPTATRLEGLLSARSFLPPAHPIHAKLDAAITSGIAFLLNAQVKKDGFQGAFTRIAASNDRRKVNSGALHPRAQEVRIDYVQHALSALLLYLKP